MMAFFVAFLSGSGENADDDGFMSHRYFFRVVRNIELPVI